MFKDHLVTWVEEYLKLTHGPASGSLMLDEIDDRFVVHTYMAEYCSPSPEESLLHRFFPVSVGSKRVVTSNNGQGTIQRCL